MERHTSKEFEAELVLLRERILAMGGRAEAQLKTALEAVANRDSELAQRVIDADDDIDNDELEIDELAQRILATRQPVASDLRFITMALKIVTDLERIGDLASNIAKRAQELVRTGGGNLLDFGPLGREVEQNLRDALDSFVKRDVDRAAKVIAADKEIDALNAGLFKASIDLISAQPANAAWLLPLTSIARSLERVGDHAKNLAEDVVFMVRGRDVRHRPPPKFGN
ncbi:MAG: phosphate signaling complex protein PhoU [Myxococcota bacterium]